jgi:hypothetical protein
MPDVEVGQVGERRSVRGYDRSARRPCGCGDQQIVRSARRALTAHFDKQLGMSLGDRDVVGDHGDRGEYVLQERGPRGSLVPCSHQCADSHLGDRDRRDGYVVLIGDHMIESVARPVGVDKKRRVEQEPSQDRSSSSTKRRMAASSPDQLLSCR